LGMIVTYRRKKIGKRKSKWKINVKKVQALYTNKFERARSNDTKAQILAQEMTNNPHIKVERKNLMKKDMKIVERELKKKFEIKPKIYVYSLKKGHIFRKRKFVGRPLGASHMPLDVSIRDGGPVYKAKDPYIILPKSHLKDPKVYRAVLMHELGESLALQERYKQPTTHQQALKVEQRVEKELGTNREEVLKKAQDLWNDPKAWK